MGFFEDVEKEYGVYSDSSTVRRDAPPVITAPGFETEPSTKTSIYDLAKENADPYISSETGTSVDTGAKLAIKDLSSLEHSTKIRKYMIDRFGAKYKNRDVISDKKMVDNFVDHMRWFNTIWYLLLAKLCMSLRQRTNKKEMQEKPIRHMIS